MKMIVSLIASLFLATGAAFAHGTGPNGGPQADAGSYHVEMVAKQTSLTLYLSEESGKPIDAKGHKATGIFVVNGKAQRIELNPGTGNALTGTAAVALPSGLKGVVQLTLPTGKTVQAKFD